MAVGAGKEELVDLVLALLFGKLDDDVVVSGVLLVGAGLDAFQVGPQRHSEPDGRGFQVAQHGPPRFDADLRLARPHGGVGIEEARDLFGEGQALQGQVVERSRSSPAISNSTGLVWPPMIDGWLTPTIASG